MCVAASPSSTVQAMNPSSYIRPNRNTLQTQYGAYESLITRFRSRLRDPSVNNCLIVLGYSFHDEHINEAICDAIVSPGSNLTVIAFVGSEQNMGQQKARFTSFAERCDDRVQCFHWRKGGRLSHWASDGSRCSKRYIGC